jgi:hypothetical protein
MAGAVVYMFKRRLENQQKTTGRGKDKSLTKQGVQEMARARLVHASASRLAASAAATENRQPGPGSLSGEPGTPLFEKFRDQKGGAADDQGGGHYNRNPADNRVCPRWGGRGQLMPAITAEDRHSLDFLPAVGTWTCFHNKNL